MRLWSFHRISSWTGAEPACTAIALPVSSRRPQAPRCLLLLSLGPHWVGVRLWVIHQNKTKAPDPLTHQELMDLGTGKAAKLLHGDSMQSWGFLRFKLKLFKNIKSGDSWQRYWTILRFPHKIWGVLLFKGLVTWKKRPPSSLTLHGFLSDRKDWHRSKALPRYAAPEE